MKPRYKRMLEGMKQAPYEGERTWGIYILRCSDDSLYTGATNDVGKRLEKHNAGRGAAYTRTRRPVRLLYSELGLTRSEALVREAQIKSLPREKKKALASGTAQ